VWAEFHKDYGLFIGGSSRDLKSCFRLEEIKDPVTGRSVDPTEVGALHQIDGMHVCVLNNKSQCFEFIFIQS
jgi:hypothetical protein